MEDFKHHLLDRGFSNHTVESYLYAVKQRPLYTFSSCRFSPRRKMLFFGSSHIGTTLR